MVCVEHHELMLQTALTLAQRGDTPPYRCHPLANVQVESFDKGRIDLPATRRSHVLDGFKSAKHHRVRDTDQTTPAGGFDHLRIQ